MRRSGGEQEPKTRDGVGEIEQPVRLKVEERAKLDDFDQVADLVAIEVRDMEASVLPNDAMSCPRSKCGSGRSRSHVSVTPFVLQSRISPGGSGSLREQSWANSARKDRQTGHGEKRHEPACEECFHGLAQWSTTRWTARAFDEEHAGANGPRGFFVDLVRWSAEKLVLD
jgi:hypothetical protein